MMFNDEFRGDDSDDAETADDEEEGDLYAPAPLRTRRRRRRRATTATHQTSPPVPSPEQRAFPASKLRADAEAEAADMAMESTVARFLFSRSVLSVLATLLLLFLSSCFLALFDALALAWISHDSTAADETSTALSSSSSSSLVALLSRSLTAESSSSFLTVFLWSFPRGFALSAARVRALLDTPSMQRITFFVYHHVWMVPLAPGAPEYEYTLPEAWFLRFTVCVAPSYLLYCLLQERLKLGSVLVRKVRSSIWRMQQRYTKHGLWSAVTGQLPIEPVAPPAFDLSRDVSLLMFSYLGHAELRSAKRVCQRWNKDINDEVLWRHLLRRDLHRGGKRPPPMGQCQPTYKTHYLATQRFFRRGAEDAILLRFEQARRRTRRWMNEVIAFALLAIFWYFIRPCPSAAARFVATFLLSTLRYSGFVGALVASRVRAWKTAGAFALAQLACTVYFWSDPAPLFLRHMRLLHIPGGAIVFLFIKPFTHVPVLALVNGYGRERALNIAALLGAVFSALVAWSVGIELFIYFFGLEETSLDATLLFSYRATMTYSRMSHYVLMLILTLYRMSQPFYPRYWTEIVASGAITAASELFHYYVEFVLPYYVGRPWLTNPWGIPVLTWFFVQCASPVLLLNACVQTVYRIFRKLDEGIFVLMGHYIALAVLVGILKWFNVWGFRPMTTLFLFRVVMWAYLYVRVGLSLARTRIRRAIFWFSVLCLLDSVFDRYGLHPEEIQPFLDAVYPGFAKILHKNLASEVRVVLTMLMNTRIALIPWTVLVFDRIASFLIHHRRWRAIPLDQARRVSLLLMLPFAATLVDDVDRWLGLYARLTIRPSESVFTSAFRSARLAGFFAIVTSFFMMRLRTARLDRITGLLLLTGAASIVFGIRLDEFSSLAKLFVNLMLLVSRLLQVSSIGLALVCLVSVSGGSYFFESKQGRIRGSVRQVFLVCVMVFCTAVFTEAWSDQIVDDTSFADALLRWWYETVTAIYAVTMPYKAVEYAFTSCARGIGSKRRREFAMFALTSTVCAVCTLGMRHFYPQLMPLTWLDNLYQWAYTLRDTLVPVPTCEEIVNGRLFFPLERSFHFPDLYPPP